MKILIVQDPNSFALRKRKENKTQTAVTVSIIMFSRSVLLGSPALVAISVLQLASCAVSTLVPRAT
jgi:hypothetical protein